MSDIVDEKAALERTIAEFDIRQADQKGWLVRRAQWQLAFDLDQSYIAACGLALLARLPIGLGSRPRPISQTPWGTGPGLLQLETSAQACCYATSRYVWVL